MTFGQRLRKTRKDKGFEAQYVAKTINVAKSTYSGYENDKTKPSFEVLQSLANIYDVSVDYLLDTKARNDENEEEDENIVILNRAAKKMDPEKRKLLLQIAKNVFKEEFE